MLSGPTNYQVSSSVPEQPLVGTNHIAPNTILTEPRQVIQGDQQRSLGTIKEIDLLSQGQKNIMPIFDNLQYLATELRNSIQRALVYENMARESFQ